MAGKRSYYSHLGAGARILEQTAVTSVVQHPASVYRKTAPIVGPHIRAQRPTTGIDSTLPPRATIACICLLPDSADR